LALCQALIQSSTWALIDVENIWNLGPCAFYFQLRVNFLEIIFSLAATKAVVTAITSIELLSNTQSGKTQNAEH
jgi:hypothetical protein